MAPDIDPNEIITNEATGQEFTVAEIENSKRIVKSATPKGDASWYIKWFGSICVLFAVSIRSAGLPDLQWVDVALSWVGAMSWFIVGFMWKDRALIILNGVIGIMLFGGIIKIIFGAVSGN